MEEDRWMQIRNYVDQRVEVNVSDPATYIGRLVKVCEKSLILRAPVDAATNKLMGIVLVFSISDVLDCKLVKPKKEEKSDDTTNPVTTSDSSNEEPKEPVLNGHSHGFLESSETEDDRPPPLSKETRNRSHPVVRDYRQFEPNEIKIIDSVNNEFYQSIQDLSEQKVIALSVDAVDIDNNATITVCWINIATNSTVYLFDMVALQYKGMSGGLQKILTSPDIQKVTHDCRLPNWSLARQYNIELSNIYDTMVADVKVQTTRNKVQIWDFKARELYICLMDYLKLKVEQVDFCEVRKMAQKERLFSMRPPSMELLNAGVESICYLLPLRLATMELMLESYTQCVDVYLKLHKNQKLDAVVKPEIPEDVKKILRGDRIGTSDTVSLNSIDWVLSNGLRISSEQYIRMNSQANVPRSVNSHANMNGHATRNEVKRLTKLDEVEVSVEESSSGEVMAPIMSPKRLPINHGAFGDSAGSSGFSTDASSEEENREKPMRTRSMIILENLKRGRSPKVTKDVVLQEEQPKTTGGKINWLRRSVGDVPVNRENEGATLTFPSEHEMNKYFDNLNKQQRRSIN